MKRSNSDDLLMTAIIMAEAHGNCCSDNALYKSGLLLLLLLFHTKRCSVWVNRCQQSEAACDLHMLSISR